MLNMALLHGCMPAVVWMMPAEEESLLEGAFLTGHGLDGYQR